MNELQNIDGFNAKIYGTAENPLFLAKDIAELIEHSRASEMLKTVDYDEKLMQPILASGQNRNMWFLTEDGLYEVLMSSKKPQAKIFKKKVKEILKTIRKHGAYMTNEVIERTLTSPDFIIQLATKLKDEQEARLELEKENSQLSLDLAEANKKLPFLEWALQTKGLVTPTIIAKKYGKTAVWLNDWLHKQGIQFKQGKCWVLYKKYDDKGYSDTIFSPTDIDHLHPSMKWTVKGMKFIYELLKENGYLPISEQDDLAS
ncbi:phage antirepressor KilAC domain-containing protein [Lactococcus lactis]|uniref:phage antirepressor KilAC domain-containing protein n=1 Tax=Lactococcus lactis TaxID=1358 RepID=UPI00189A28D5|nr:phage antirepressor KilAC domain-containing protein [Lactococcus lactis]MCT3132485.1 phage antirepressor [Lactococcus lactis]